MAFLRLAGKLGEYVDERWRCAWDESRKPETSFPKETLISLPLSGLRWVLGGGWGGHWVHACVARVCVAYSVKNFKE